MVFDRTMPSLCVFTGVSGLLFSNQIPLEDGSFRATTWSGIEPLSMYLFDDEELYWGSRWSGKYDTQQDNGNSYDELFLSSARFW